MKLFVPTSDQYSHLIPLFISLMKEYWPKQETIFLTYKYQKIDEENFKTISLGKQLKSWTDPLREYFESIDDQLVALTLEDMIPITPVDIKKIEILKNWILNKKASKAIMHNHLNIYAEVSKENKDIMILNPNAPYRCTIHPSIWDREYLIEYLKPNRSLWDFEILGSQEMKQDNKTIISYASSDSQTNHPFNALNIYRGSKIDLSGNFSEATEKTQKLIKDFLEI